MDKTRRLLEDLVDGHSLFGAEGYLPACYPLVTLWDYLPEGSLTVIERPADVVAAIAKSGVNIAVVADDARREDLEHDGEAHVLRGLQRLLHQCRRYRRHLRYHLCPCRRHRRCW